MLTGYIKKLKSRRNKKRSLPYIDGDQQSIHISEFYMDMRNPKAGKKYISIDRDSYVNLRCVFETQEGRIDIGKKVYAGGCSIICKNQIIIEDHAVLAWDILLYDHNSHSLDYRERRKDIEHFLSDKRGGQSSEKFSGKNWSVVKDAPIHICKDAWVGEGCTILAGVTIGEGAVIGAGSVVRESIPPWTIAYGNPCRVVAENRNKPELMNN